MKEPTPRPRDAAPTLGDERAPVPEQQTESTLCRYTPPRLERLGTWSALTLQQSIPIFP